ncbi:MAG TPA: hypothetical protein VK439_09505 [Rubrivivax sp.]|jgi:hypothetical protein|nr:hypothetical protein [Rubrivivax sp.]
MPSQTAQIVGKVEYREGDGPKIAIRPGPIEVSLTSNDATLSWTDEDTRGSTAIPLTEFKRFCSEGAIVMSATPDTPDPAP